jgi:hypothetical protein
MFLSSIKSEDDIESALPLDQSNSCSSESTPLSVSACRNDDPTLKRLLLSVSFALVRQNRAVAQTLCSVEEDIFFSCEING